MAFVNFTRPDDSVVVVNSAVVVSRAAVPKDSRSVRAVERWYES